VEPRLPHHFQEQPLTEIAAVEKDDQGEPLFLEGYVDAWLNDQYAASPGCRAGDDFLTIREVAHLLHCSYTEVRDRMLDGRIRTIRDGRWLRTRREWVEQYVAAKTIKPPDPDVFELPRPRGRRHVVSPAFHFFFRQYTRIVSAQTPNISANFFVFTPCFLRRRICRICSGEVFRGSSTSSSGVKMSFQTSHNLSWTSKTLVNTGLLYAPACGSDLTGLPCRRKTPIVSPSVNFRTSFPAVLRRW